MCMICVNKLFGLVSDFLINIGFCNKMVRFIIILVKGNSSIGVNIVLLKC